MTGISSHEDDTLPTIHPVQEACACIVPGVSPHTTQFPLSFYAVDVHRSFSFERQGDLMLEIQFQRFFNIPFKSSTFYDHKARWLQALRDARDRAVTAGYDDDGRYTKFMAAHAAKDTDLKAAQRKMRAVTDKQM